VKQCYGILTKFKKKIKININIFFITNAIFVMRKTTSI